MDKIKLLFIIGIFGIISNKSISFPVAEPKIVVSAIRTCDYIIPDLNGWKPKGNAFKFSNSIKSLTLKKKNVDAVILCVDKSVTMQQWIKGTKQNLGRQFKEYKLLDGYSRAFHGKDAYWFVYIGKANLGRELYKGRLLIVDLGNRGFIVSLACPERVYKDQSYLFDEIIDLILPNYSFSE